MILEIFPPKYIVGCNIYIFLPVNNFKDSQLFSAFPWCTKMHVIFMNVVCFYATRGHYVRDAAVH